MTGGRSRSAQIRSYVELVQLTAQMLTILLSTWKIYGMPEAYATPAFGILVVGLLLVITLSGASDFRSGRSTVGSGRAFVLVGLVAMLMHFTFWDPVPADPLPPLDNVIAAAMGLAALVFPWRAAMVVQLCFVVLWLPLLIPSLGLVGAFGISLTTALAGGACIAGYSVATEGSAALRAASAVERDGRRLDLEALSRAQAIARWDDLIHRHVIGAFLTASAGDVAALPRARQQASTALAAIDGLSRSADTFRHLVRDVADEYGLEVTLDVTGDWSPIGPMQALASAVTEALRNVYRHSGTRSATVTATFRQGHWVVRISDHGRGFDPGLTTVGHGIQSSVRQQWQLAGGASAVTSMAGRGTVVSLDWRAPSALNLNWRPQAEPALAAVALVSTISQAAAGLALSETVRFPLVSVAGALIIVASTLVAIVRPAQAWGVAVTLVAAELVLAWNLSASDPTLWKYWMCGSTAGTLGALAYQGRFRAATVAWVGCFVGSVVGAGMTSGHAPVTHILGAYAGPGIGLAFALTAWLVREARESIKLADDARRLALESMTASQVSARRWSAENRLFVDAVVPVLRALSEATESGPPPSRLLQAHEAACRDHLRVPGMLSAGTAAIVLRARKNGVRVDLALGAPASDVIEQVIVRACATTEITDLVVTDGDRVTSVLVRPPCTELLEELTILLGASQHLVLTPLSTGALFEWNGDKVGYPAAQPTLMSKTSGVSSAEVPTYTL